MSFPFSGGRFKSWLADGTPNAGGRLYTYSSGTTTFKAVFTDSTLATPATYTSDGIGGSYLALDSRGEVQAWIGSGAYSLVEKTAAGTLIATTNGVSDATAGALGTINADVSALQAAVAALRTGLTGDRTYYVRTDGSDSNDGLTNTNTGAFLTIQKAVDTIRNTLDLNGHNVTISVGAGTYTGATVVSGPWGGSGTVAIVGNTGTPSSVVLSTTSADCFTATNGANVQLRGVKLATATSGNCIVASLGSYVTVDHVEYGASVGYHNDALAGATISLNAPYTISGGAVSHMFAGGSGANIVCGAGTVTLTGTPAFSSYTAWVQNNGVITVNPVTYSGSATGSRYLADSGGVINANPVTLPGSSAGSTSNGGVYV